MDLLGRTVGLDRLVKARGFDEFARSTSYVSAPGEVACGPAA